VRRDLEFVDALIPSFFACETRYGCTCRRNHWRPPGLPSLERRLTRCVWSSPTRRLLGRANALSFSLCLCTADRLPDKRFRAVVGRVFQAWSLDHPARGLLTAPFLADQPARQSRRARKRLWSLAAAGVAAFGVLEQAPAQDAVTVPASAAETEGITIVGREDDLTGVATTASQGTVGAIDLKQRPILRRGELLEVVPGLIITQHSGEAKAVLPARVQSRSRHRLLRRRGRSAREHADACPRPGLG
jgi:hypothetical protein